MGHMLVEIFSDINVFNTTNILNGKILRRIAILGNGLLAKSLRINWLCIDLMTDKHELGFFKGHNIAKRSRCNAGLLHLV